MPEAEAHDGTTVYLPVVPEPGQLVGVRRRRWVTTRAAAPTLSEKQQIRSGGSPQHLVSSSGLGDAVP